MYDLSHLSEVLDAGHTFVNNNDRLLYKPFFEAVAAICKKHHGILGGKFAVSLIKGEDTEDIDSWDIYSVAAWPFAKSLADALALVRSPHVPKYIKLETLILNTEFVISVNTRPMFRIFSIRLINDVATTMSLYEPLKIKDMPVLNVTLMLAAMFRDLYDPSMIGDWPQIAAYAKKICEQHLQSMRDQFATLKTKLGGDDEDALVFRKHPLLRWVAKIGAIVVGDLAYALHSDITMSPQDKVTILSDLSAEEVASSLTEHIGSDVTFDTYKVGLPDDWQILRYVFKKVSSGGVLVEMFNSPSYELVPFTRRGTLRIATPVVQLRFKLIEIWLVRFVSFIVKDVVKTVNFDPLEYYLARLDDAAVVPNKDNYYGRRINASVAKKKLISEKQDFKLKPYFPNYY